MVKNKKVLALILARSGSKGLKGKNIRNLCGKPLISWTIECALKSKYIDRVVVSTDSRRISGIARSYGADAPFIRPKRLAMDNSNSIDAILHALKWLKDNQAAEFELLILLQPTSPLRAPKDIDDAINLLFLKKADAVISVCRADHHPFIINTLPADGCMRDFLAPVNRNRNRQKLPEFYRLNGAIYLSYSGYLKKNESFFGNKTYAYIMPQERSVDIDNGFDFSLAEFLSKKNGIRQ